VPDPHELPDPAQPFSWRAVPTPGAEPAPGPTPEDPGDAARRDLEIESGSVLLFAQRVADDTIEDARREAERIIEEARAAIPPVPEVAPEPVRDFGSLYEELDERTLLGFGGVSEYGITVRWDKNFLTVLYVTLARNRRLKIYGGIRFGGTMTLEDAWALGFDHVALAAGAGRPTIIDMKNNLARGIRKASDFLMALQLTGAYKRSSLANLQIQLPAVVVGGGLTAIDTATELLAYYPVQVEKVAARVDRLTEAHGKDAVRKMFDDEEWEALQVHLTHARELALERAFAANEGREPRIQQLLTKWGGVTLVYRKALADSPAYRLNHEEV